MMEESMEAGDSNAEAGPSRPRRSRQAPQKYDSSQHAAQHRRARGTRSASVSTRLAKLNDEYTKETDYLAGYTYDHVGQVMKEKNPSVWVDVPVLPDIRIYPQISPPVAPKKRKRKRKEPAVTEPRASQPSTSLLPLIPDKEIETAEQDTYEVETMIDNLHRPIQDVLSPLQSSTILSDGNTIPSLSLPGLSRSIKMEEENQSIESDQLETQASNHAASPKLVSAPNSPSPVHFVDASEDLSPLLPTATDTNMKTLPVYHPEMRLSHDKQEGSTRTSPRRSSVPMISREAKKRKSSLVGHSLFLGGSEGEEEESLDNDQRRIAGGVSRSTGKATTLSTALPQPKSGKPTSAVSFADADEIPRNIKSLRALASASASASPATAQAGPSQSLKKAKQVLKGKASVKDSAETSKEQQKKRLRGQSANGIGHGVVRIASSSDDDLVQNLNIDNYVKSTGNGGSKAVRAKQLERLRKTKEKAERRRQGEDSAESITSGSESESQSSSESSEEVDVDEDSFIVDDTSQSSSIRPVETVTHQAHRTLSPPPLSVPKHPAHIARLSRKEKLQEYIRWLVIYALEIPIEKDDDNRLKAVRQDLQDKFRMNYRSLLTQANRQQFTWYLTHFPCFERRQMTKQEKQERIGCHACRRKSQRCEYAFTFWGDKYNEKTLEQWSDDHHTSSAMSSNGEDLKTVSKFEKKKRYTFFLGETCAQFASVKHKIYHWERRVLQEVIKMPEFKVLKRETLDDIGGEHIETVVDAYIPKLLKRYTTLETDARDLVTKATISRQRMVDRWDLD